MEVYRIGLDANLNIDTRISKNPCNLYKNIREMQKKNKYLSFDSSIHETMAEINKYSGDGRTEFAMKQLDMNWVSEGYESFEEEHKFKSRAQRILINYCFNPQDLGEENLIINRNISIKIDKNTSLFSKIDKVHDRGGGCIELIDYKSGYIIRHKQNFELTDKTAILAELINYKLGVYPDYLSYYYLNYNKKFIRRISDIDKIHIKALLYSNKCKHYDKMF